MRPSEVRAAVSGDDLPDLVCRDLTRTFDGTRAVDGVSFEVPQGSFFSILGPSGCGKTTLLRMIAGFQMPTSGEMRIKGQSMLGVPPNRRPVSMVFQHLALFPTMDVGDNVGFGLRQRRVPRDEIRTRVERVLERVGLPGMARRRVDQLSGGQKQRVAIARCMVLEPAVLLLDEPLGALDLKLREHMKVELKSLQAAFNTTFVYITHDQSEALVMSDTVAVMNHGRFEQVGPPQEVYHAPRTAFVAGFVGEANRVRGRVAAVDGSRLTVTAEDGAPLSVEASGAGLASGDRVEVFLRPEVIALTRGAATSEAGANARAGVVTSVLFNGANSMVTVRDSGSGGLMSVALPQTGALADLRVGDPVVTGWHPHQARCYRAADA